jgi:serine/threonine-protein kinase RIO1
MSFIGKDTQSAPKLKEVKLSTEDMQDAFEQTIDVRFIYRKLLIMCQNNHTQKNVQSLCSNGHKRSPEKN